MFSDVLEKISWDETTQKIASKTDADVVRALAKERLDVDDFMALISPAAVPHLEEMARLSQKIHAGTIRKNHQHVHPALPEQRLH